MIGHSKNGLNDVESLEDVLFTQDNLVSLRKNIYRIDYDLSHRYKVAYGRARSDAENALNELEEMQAAERRNRKLLTSTSQVELDRDRIKNRYPRYSDSNEYWLMHMFFNMIVSPEGEVNSLERHEQLFWGYFADQLLINDEPESQQVLRSLFNEAGLVEGSTISMLLTQTGERQESRLQTLRWFNAYPRLFIEREAYNDLHEQGPHWSQFMNAVEAPIVIVGT